MSLAPLLPNPTPPAPDTPLLPFIQRLQHDEYRLSLALARLQSLDQQRLSLEQSLVDHHTHMHTKKQMAAECRAESITDARRTLLTQLQQAKQNSEEYNILLNTKEEMNYNRNIHLLSTLHSVRCRLRTVEIEYEHHSTFIDQCHLSQIGDWCSADFDGYHGFDSAKTLLITKKRFMQEIFNKLLIGNDIVDDIQRRFNYDLNLKRISMAKNEENDHSKPDILSRKTSSVIDYVGDLFQRLKTLPDLVTQEREPNIPDGASSSRSKHGPRRLPVKRASSRSSRISDVSDVSDLSERSQQSYTSRDFEYGPPAL